MEPGTGMKEPLEDAQQSPMSPHHRHAFAPKWPAVAGTLAIGLLYLLLPQRLRIGPSWLLLLLEVLLLIPLLFSWATGHPLTQGTIRLLSMLLLGFVTLGLAISIAYFVFTLPEKKAGTTLLGEGALLWFSNVLVFALWYFEIDGGGPHKRFHSKKAADLLFPQQVDGNKAGWVPDFIDYLFVAFTGSTALSPADTFPLTHRAKLLMMVQALLSIVITIILVGRAVNILGS
jgi:uncharacterized membrane protein